MLYSFIVGRRLTFTIVSQLTLLSVGRPKHLRVMAGAIQDNLFIGRRAQEFRGLLKIKYPMEHGVVMDWDDMERIWGWVYGEGLKALSEEVRWLCPYQFPTDRFISILCYLLKHRSTLDKTEI